MEIIEDLQNKKIELISQGKYIEANTIKQQIDIIKNNTKHEYEQAEKDNQIKIIDDLDQSLIKELKEINAYYDERSAIFIQEAKIAEVDLFEAHRKEMDEYIEKLDNSISKTVKFSKKYLDLKKNEANAVKQDNLIKANYYKTDCDALEQLEVNEFTKNRNHKIDQLARNYLMKQDREKKTLKQKLDLNYEKMQQERATKINIVKQKYKNQKNMLSKVNPK